MEAWSIPRALWLFLPAFVANMSPVITAKLIPRWKAPIDRGRFHKDGGRVLGDGKTWRGLTGGMVAGAGTAVGMALLAIAAQPSWLAGWDFGVGGYAGGELGATAPCEVGQECSHPRSSLWEVAVAGAIIGGFALVGDAVESFFKRRRGIDRGGAWFPFDQLDFVIFGLIGMLVAAPLLADGWVFEALFGDWLILATILLGSIALHLFVNRIGYWLGLKEVPW